MTFDYRVTVSADETVTLVLDKGSYRAPLGANHLTRQLVERLDRFVARHAEVCEVDDLRLLGSALFQILFEGGEAVQFAVSDSNIVKTFDPVPGRTLGTILRGRMAGQAPTAVRLSLEFAPAQSALAKFPWEFLYIQSQPGHGFFAVDEDISLSITRLVSPMVTRSLKSPLKVLVVSAAPSSLGKVDNIDLIATTIQNQLKRLGALEFEHIVQVTWKGLESHLEKAGKDGPDIVHFIGHGNLNPGGKSVLAFIPDPDSRSRLPRNLQDQDAPPPDVDWVDVGDLANLVRNAPPWLFFLQSCKGSASDVQVEAARSAAQQFADVAVPFVVAMQYEIANDDAAIFSETFYKTLSAREPVDNAVREGRKKLGKKRPAWQHRRFATPVVYLRSDEQVLNVADAGSLQVSAGTPLCPYKCGRALSDLDSRECACDQNRMLRYCTENHVNRIDALECINRRCTGVLPPLSQPGAMPLAMPFASEAAPAAPIAAQRDPTAA